MKIIFVSIFSEANKSWTISAFSLTTAKCNAVLFKKKLFIEISSKKNQFSIALKRIFVKYDLII